MHALWQRVHGFSCAQLAGTCGSLTGALCVWLLVKQNIWNWPIGITNNIFYIVIFYKSGLYADAGLQFVYIAIRFTAGGTGCTAGWSTRAQSKNRLGTRDGGYLGLAAASTAVLYWLLKRFLPAPSLLPTALP